ncbi:GAF and ANTAR domain-containing protein [Nocardioides furvisabuli]|nr:GAF and ANTAR domain-containing protein [Nocardioides furvisabuli]
MTPMEPIPETLEALELLEGEPSTLLDRLVWLAERARQVVPELVGVSIARQHEGLAFTLVASTETVAALDAVQYVDGGPCVDAARAVDATEFTVGDAVDEQAWHLFALATAAHGVRSTLTLPVLAGGQTVGTVNMYAATRHGFDGHHQELADLFGAWAEGAVANADLSFSTRLDARATPGRVRDQAVVDTAVELLADHLDVDEEGAEARLHQAAVRAGVDPVDVAHHIVRTMLDRDTGSSL